jgi:SAM-dependent methyltransferase
MQSKRSLARRMLRAVNFIFSHATPRRRERRRLERMVGPVGVWDELQRFQIGCLKEMGLKPAHDLLDVGCGPLQGGLAFIAYLEPGKYAGIDLREECIIEAREQVLKAGLTAKAPFLAVSNTFGREELGDRSFDYFWASQLLYHLPESGLSACFEQIARRMKPGARMLGDFMLAGGACARSDNAWRGFYFHYRTFEFYEQAAGNHGLRMFRHGLLRDHGYPTKGTLGLSNNELVEFRKP